MEIHPKPQCEYGSNCYRKNPEHFKEYSHPGEKVKEEKKKRTEEKQQVSKKPKLDIVKESAKRPMLDIVKEPAKMKIESPQSEKKATTKVQDTKKLKQTTLNFFTKTDDKKKSPEGDKKTPKRTSPRKQTQSNSKKEDESSKIKTSPRRNESQMDKIKAQSPEKIKDVEKTSPKKVKANVDYISDSEEETRLVSPVLSRKDDKVNKLRIAAQKTETPKEIVKAQSPKKIIKKASPKKTQAVHYLSDSDEEMFTELAETFEDKQKIASEKAEQTEKTSSAVKPDGNTKIIIEESDVEEDEESKVEEKEETKEAPKISSWTYIKKAPAESSEKVSKKNKSDSNEDLIKNLFLVDMPQDFYNFFEFCKDLDSSQPMKALQVCGLRLVGPFDVLAGNKQLIEKGNAVCHWRYYYDPPEFQTVLSGEKGFHMGYWRDDPNEPPVFVASNNSHDCVFKIEAENIFGALHFHLNDYIKTCDPFVKLKISKLQSSLNKWAEEHNITLKKTTDAMTRRQKRVVSKTLHKAGIVVPYDPKTELGYRPLIETEANLKKICKLIMNSTDQTERDGLWDNLQPLVTAANIANDECDFGNSLELGIDLFCMGSPVFHDTIEHLLTTSYSLLRRSEFGEIIKLHLKDRKKGTHLSIV